MESRSTIEHNRAFLYDFPKDIPYLWPGFFNLSSCTFNIVSKSLFYQFPHYEWLE